jgi:hypothetical protein
MEMAQLTLFYLVAEVRASSSSNQSEKPMIAPLIFEADLILY